MEARQALKVTCPWMKGAATSVEPRDTLRLIARVPKLITKSKQVKAPTNQPDRTYHWANHGPGLTERTK